MKNVAYTIKSRPGLLFPIELPVKVLKKGSHAELSQEYYNGKRITRYLYMAEVTIEPAAAGLNN